MPGGDRTGPYGAGPLTGRAAGFCAGYTVPGYMNPFPGRGFRRGFGRGGGHGWRNRFYTTGMTGWQRASYQLPVYDAFGPGAYGPPEDYTKEQEIELLKNQAENLEEALSGITKRIRELESDKQSPDS